MHTDVEILTLLAAGDRTAAGEDDLAHLSACADCAAELDSWRVVATLARAVVDERGQQEPPPRVWSAIRAELGLDPSVVSVVSVDQPLVKPVQAAEPVAQSLPTSTRHRPRRRQAALALVAAVIVVALAVGAAVVLPRVLRPPATVVAETTLTALPAWSGSSGEAVLERDGDGRRWLVVTVHPSRRVDGLQQVWLINRKVTAMLQVGLLSETRQRFLLPPEVDLITYPVVDVSDEPPTDDGAHSGNSIVRGVLIT